MIDLKLKYTTRDGLEVLELFHYPENKDHSRIMGFVRLKDGSVRFYDWYENGRNMMTGEGSALDLVLAPVEITRWFNVYLGEGGSTWMSTGCKTKEEAADMTKSKEWISTVKLTFTVPQK